MRSFIRLLSVTAMTIVGTYGPITAPAYAAAPLTPEMVTREDEAYLTAEFSYNAVKFFSGPPAVHIRLLRNDTPDNLARIRRACAMHSMPRIYEAVARDGVKARAEGGKATAMPDLTTYCLTAIDEAKQRKTLDALYINLALQEQGYRSLHFSEQAQLLKNNEPGRTLAAVLQAANAGQSTYTSITGKSRDLPCPLALDAGAAWANGNAKANVPISLTQAEANTIAHQCYDPTVTQITVHGTTLPAAKAGLITGAWLAKNGF